MQSSGTSSKRSDDAIGGEHRPCGFLVSAVVHLIALIILALVRIAGVSCDHSGTLLCSQADEPSGIEDADSLPLSPIVEPPKADDDKPDPEIKPKNLPVVDASLAIAAPTVERDAPPKSTLARPVSARSTERGPSKPLDDGGSGGAEDADGEASDPQGVFGPRRGPMRQSSTPQDAVDGLGGDIARALLKDDVLVVWMFDASLSMQADREMAGQRMVTIFRALDERTKDKGDFHHFESLLAFGQGSTQLAPPTRKWNNVARKVPNIALDVSGIENTFTCLQRAVPAYRKAWSKELLVVVWTDESGNDVEQLEYTIEICRQHRAKVSVVGPTALFGHRRGYQRIQFNQFSGFLPVDRGPETGLVESVLIPYWYCPKEFGGVLSGFGPYPLVRLSQATGGSFTLYDQLAQRSKYRIEDLTAYVPDYRDVSKLEEDAEAHPLRSAVVRACKTVAELSELAPPNMYPNSVLWHPPAEYQRLLAGIVSADLRDVQRARPIIEKAVAILSDEELEKKYAYQQEKSPRWRANYLLAKGRLLALSVRYREYELLATSILQGSVLRAATNHAVFRPDKRLQSGEWGKQRSDEAERCLNQCIQEHGNTPWAVSASSELSQPFGIAVQESQMQPAGRVRPGGVSAPPPRL